MLSRGSMSRVAGWAWLPVALLSILVGSLYLITEPMILDPGGWFALDGRRVLEAGTIWRAGGDPYEIAGFVYSPVAIVVAVVASLLPPVPVLLTWIAVSIVAAAVAVWREVRATPPVARALAAVAVLFFIPTIADLILVNVTIALVVAAWAAIRRDTLSSGVALGLLGAAFPKPFLVPIVLWLLIWRRRAAIGVLGSAVTASFLATVAVGAHSWIDFAGALRSVGTGDLDFIGNYGITKLAPAIAPIVVTGAIAAYVFVLWRRDPGSSLVAATAVGVVATPYAGIYAGLPLLLAIRTVEGWSTRVALIVTVVAILSAPWAILPSAVLLVLALAKAARRPLIVYRSRGA